MRNKNNRVPLILQFHKLDKKLICFLRSKHCRRFIQNQNFCPSVKSFQNFYLLLNTYRYFLHLLINIKVKIILLCNIPGSLYSFIHINKQAFLRRNTQNNILCHCQRGYQHKMLMYHSNPLADSLLWRFYCCFLTIQNNITLIRCFQAKKHLHQCTFPGTVFSQKCMDLSFSELKGYIFIGNHTISINLHNVAHL